MGVFVCHSSEYHVLQCFIEKFQSLFSTSQKFHTYLKSLFSHILTWNHWWIVGSVEECYGAFGFSSPASRCSLTGRSTQSSIYAGIFIEAGGTMISGAFQGLCTYFTAQTVSVLSERWYLMFYVLFLCSVYLCKVCGISDRLSALMGSDLNFICAQMMTNILKRISFFLFLFYYL